MNSNHLLGLLLIFLKVNVENTLEGPVKIEHHKNMIPITIGKGYIFLDRISTINQQTIPGYSGIIGMKPFIGDTLIFDFQKNKLWLKHN